MYQNKITLQNNCKINDIPRLHAIFPQNGKHKKRNK